jgi:carboxylesterase type B
MRVYGGWLHKIFLSSFSGKFVGVTVQSGCSGAPWAIQKNPGKHAHALATKLGCPTTPTHDLVDCVRNFSPQLIMKVSPFIISSHIGNNRLSVQNAKLEDGLSLAFAAVIDGKFLKEAPEALIKSKSFQTVPILTGFTKDEVTIWFTKCKSLISYHLSQSVVSQGSNKILFA